MTKLNVTEKIESLNETVSDEKVSNLEYKKELLELELREEKADTQKSMAWVAMISMLIFTLGLFLPIFNDSRITALGDILGLFYIAQAGVVGAYMGFTTWMNRK